jgi:hypothetical protein
MTINNLRGKPFEAELHSTDASSGVALVMYEPGTTTVITLGADEYIEVTWLHLIAVVSADTHVILGPDASVGVNEAIVRGTYAANGGFAGDTIDPPKVGAIAATLWVTAAAGVVDVAVRGVIRKVDNTGARPAWRETTAIGPA